MYKKTPVETPFRFSLATRNDRSSIDRSSSSLRAVQQRSIYISSTPAVVRQMRAQIGWSRCCPPFSADHLPSYVQLRPISSGFEKCRTITERSGSRVARWRTPLDEGGGSTAIGRHLRIARGSRYHGWEELAAIVDVIYQYYPNFTGPGSSCKSFATSTVSVLDIRGWNTDRAYDTRYRPALVCISLRRGLVVSEGSWAGNLFEKVPVSR